MTLYYGYVVGPMQWVVQVIERDGTPRNLKARTDEVNHSPDGFAWGYAGSAPAQLAYAMLRDVTGDKALSERLYQAFKTDVIAKLDKDESFRLHTNDIIRWVDEHR